MKYLPKIPKLLTKTENFLYQIFEKENFFFSFNRFIQYFKTKNL